MRYNFIEPPKIRFISHLPLLLCIMASLICSTGLWQKYQRVVALEETLAIATENLSLVWGVAQEEQESWLRDAALREQQGFILDLKSRQKVVSQTISSVLSWLPSEVVLSGMQADSSGVIVFQGTSSSLQGIANMLRYLEQDPAYRLQSLSPVIYAHAQVRYSFTLTVTSLLHPASRIIPGEEGYDGS
ncbi:MAG: hypothetical protein FWF06_05455 [Symbiobacteriaceae bacterium]|nr:hypothetical protein [Symbiobacteriaceae bacterium]